MIRAMTFQDRLVRYAPFLIFIAAMLWASDAPFRYHLTRELSASFIVLAEHAVNILLVLPFVVSGWQEIRVLTWRQWVAVLVIGVGASALASILFTKTFSYVNPSVAIVLQKLQPLVAISLAAIFLRERIGKRFWLWALVALAGAYIISFPDLRPQLYAGEGWNPNTVGVLLAVGAAALWALGTVVGRYALGTAMRFQTLTALRFLVAFVFLLFLNARAETFATVSMLSAKDVLFIIIVAVTSGFVSLMVYYKGLQHTKASIATIAEIGFPFLAVIVNAAALSMFVQPMQLAGMLLLLLAVWQLTRVNRTESAAP